MPQRLGEPFPVDTLSIGVGLVAVAELLGQVLGEIADARAESLDPASTPWASNLAPNRAT